MATIGSRPIADGCIGKEESHHRAGALNVRGYPGLHSGLNKSVCELLPERIQACVGRFISKNFESGRSGGGRERIA